MLDDVLLWAGPGADEYGGSLGGEGGDPGGWYLASSDCAYGAVVDDVPGDGGSVRSG